MRGPAARPGHRFASPALVLLLLLAVLLFVACGEEEAATTGDEGTPKAGGTFNYAIGANPPFIDPVRIAEFEGAKVAHQVFEGLVRYETGEDGTMRAVPNIAESWTSNDDATEWTFTLKRGVTFQAPVGREVTAQDFIDCWDYATDPANQSYTSYILSPIEGCGDDGYQVDPDKGLTGVSAPDDQTLVVRLRFSFAEFPTTLGHLVASVWPVEYLEKVGEKAFRAKPIGTGPYLVDTWVKNRYIDLAKNPQWWNTAAVGPYVDKVHMAIITETDVAWLQFRKGETDLTSVPSGQRQSCFEMPEVKSGEWMAVKWPALSINYVGINHADPVLGGDENLEVRQALAYSTDREALVNVILEGVGRVAEGFVPNGIKGAELNPLPYPHDVEKAKELLGEVGPPPELQHWYATDSTAQRVSEALQAGWEEAGLQVELSNFEWGTLLDRLASGDRGSGSQLFAVGWIADYPSMDNFLFPIFHSSQAQYMYTFYSNPRVDALIEQARATIDEPERLRLYAEAERIALEDVAVIPTDEWVQLLLSNNRIANFKVDAMGFTDAWTVWVK